MKIIKNLALIATLLVPATPNWAADVWRDGAFRGTVILSVTGNVALATRGASSDDVDKFFSFNDITFEKAAQFDFAGLQALPQIQVMADFPKGGPVYTFEGPTLQSVLETAGATGEVVTIRALDGYAVEIPMKEAIASGAIISLKRDGIPFAIGDFGPTHVVFPRAEREELAEMTDDWWVWSIYHIHIE